MERYTFIDKNGFYIDGANGEVWRNMRSRFYGKAIDRLAAYEDTGLEPDSIEEAKEAVGRAAIELAYYHKAEQEGRLLVLPCKVGDMVYTIIDGKIYEGEVYHISYSDYYGKVTSAVRTKINFLTASIGVAFEDFGKTAFFTRAAAEAALGKEAMANGY